VTVAATNLDPNALAVLQTTARAWHTPMPVRLAFAASEWRVVRWFYTHILALPELHDVAPGRTLRIAADPLRIELVPVDPWQAVPRPGRVALHVRNLEGVRSRLRAGGFVLREILASHGRRLYRVHDPAGNAVDLIDAA
jgi:catechol 2,3-dioxygenase-like lactoylglutathione lyase family enzyme